MNRKLLVSFPLPSGGSGIPANMKANEISVAIMMWAAMYGVTYQDLNVKRIIRKGVCMEIDEDLFAQFKLTWHRPELKYKIIQNNHE